MTISKKEREAVYQKYGGKCAYCGTELNGKWQLDHLIPRLHLDLKPPKATFEQVHCIDNYMPACNSCNNYKGPFTLEGFRKNLQKQTEVLRRDRPTVRLAERYGLVKFEDKPVVFYFETLREVIK